MKSYFYLQYIMLNRKIQEAGINPLLAYLLGFTAFIFFTAFLFYKTEFAKYLLILISLHNSIKLSELNRLEFLITTFGDQQYRKIRILENIIVSLPFIIVLLFKNAIVEAIILLIIDILMSFSSFNLRSIIAIPTPFSKNPFEFIVGFRSTFYVLPISYTLSVIAITVGNLNLGIFSFLLLFLVSMSFYTKQENEYFIWIHSSSPKGFIFRKIVQSTKNITILVVPIILSLMFFFSSEITMILLFYLIGLLFLWTMILIKYASYPMEMSIPEGIMIAFSLYFPPFLLAWIPFLYIKSIRKLKPILNDKN